MQFFVEITSNPGDAQSPPCPEATVFMAGEVGEDEYDPVFTVEISSLEELLAFVNKHGRIILSQADEYNPKALWWHSFEGKGYNPETMPSHSIEIYNGYRE